MNQMVAYYIIVYWIIINGTDSAIRNPWPNTNWHAYCLIAAIELLIYYQSRCLNADAFVIKANA